MKAKHWIMLGLGAAIAGGTSVAVAMGAGAPAYLGIGLSFLAGVYKMFMTAPGDAKGGAS